MKELIVVGKMNHKTDHSFESRNRVYDRGGGVHQHLLQTDVAKMEASS